MSPRMPNAWIVAAVAAAAGGIFGSSTSALSMYLRPMRIGDFAAAEVVDARSPKASLSTAEHDFGSMSAGKTGRHRFVVTNEGASPLSLTKGVSSCRCTVADLERPEIPPGESAEVVIEWKTKSDGGPFRQTVSVRTNDPRRPEIAFSIFGTVVPAWRAIPAAVVFPRLGTHGTERVGVKLLTYLSPSPTVKRVSIDDSSDPPETSADAAFSFQTRPLDAKEIEEENDPHATGGYAIEIAPRPGLPIGPIRRMLRVELATEEQSSQDGEAAQDGDAGILVEIPIEGTVTADLAVAGKAWDSLNHAVSLGPVKASQGLRTELFLTVKGPHRERVAPTLKEVVPGSLQVDIGESKAVGSGSVRRVPITITIPAGSPSCNHLGSQQAPAGRIVLETGHPDVPLLTLPVRVSIGP